MAHKMNGGKPHGGKSYDSGFSAFQQKGLISPAHQEVEKVDIKPVKDIEKSPPTRKVPKKVPLTPYQIAAKGSEKGSEGVTYGGVTKFVTTEPKGRGGKVSTTYRLEGGGKALKSDWEKARTKHHMQNP